MRKYLVVLPKGFWKTLFGINFAIGLIVLYPLFLLFLSSEKHYPKAFAVMRFWARWILIVPGIRVQIDQHIKELPQPCIICANHTSYLDIVVSYVVLSRYFVFMGKQELQKAPLFNIFFKKMNILVDRQSRVSSHRAFVRAADDIDKGHSVFIFPEATISKKAPTLINFKNGAFKLAIDKQVPILPMTFLNNWHLLQNGGFFKSFGKPGTARVVIHEAIPTTGKSEEDLVSLRQQTREIIEAPLLSEYEN